MAKKSPPAPRTFQEAIEELEQILSEMESGQLGLEDSLARYERGTQLSQYCRGVLNAAEKKIETIGRAADGGLVVAPMTPADDTRDATADDASEELERPAVEGQS